MIKQIRHTGIVVRNLEKSANFYRELGFVDDNHALEEGHFIGLSFPILSTTLNGEIVEGVSTQVPEHVQKEFQVVKLIDGYRTRGHLFTKTNPVNPPRIIPVNPLLK